MAQVILGGIGGAVGGSVGRLIGGVVGRALDNGLVAALTPPREGPRIDGLRVQSSAEGAGLAFAMGRTRVAGQVIWASRFRERRVESGGGKGGPERRDYAYSLSFAVALCEGPIDGVGRIWADNQPMDLTGVTMRVHRGTEDQTPDPLIAAVEGQAPAYRGIAYLVFEDLPLADFGNRPPMISAEVFRRPLGDGPRLEDRLEGVCLIPGAGEFVLATEPVVRRSGLTRVESENVHAPDGRPDLIVSLDQLEAQCPNLKRVSLVVGWFGTSLAAGDCVIRPGVERREKATEPLVWSAAGETRETAHLISGVEGRPAYGGTPSDETVRQAIRELKRRGWEVTLYPFIFMDCEGYPWRGRIAATSAATAEAEIAAFIDGPEGLRRMALHYAEMAAEEGADGVLIGSELRGVTTSRATDGSYPAVARLRSLATEAKAVVGAGVKVSYAADWSEYFGHQPGDGSGDRMFHLDPLWADPAIDYVGIDWYPPMGDWRDGEAHLDALAGARGPEDAAYLRTQMDGGEGFDWYYADEAARLAQDRTAIVDLAHGEDWVFRPKDLRGWWSAAHHDRPGGVRATAPTAWVPGMKPIRLTEFGCAALDRGGNAPNLFQDAKSTESALPPFSRGGRDDRMQRRLLEAVLSWIADPESNPVSPVYGEPMIQAADAWCWDARPFPAFPALGERWADAGAWATGHWLNGRLNGETADLIRAVLARGGVEGDAVAIAPLDDAASGIVIARPTRLREALEPLLLAADAGLAERDGRVAVTGPEVEAQLTLGEDELEIDEAAPVERLRRLASPIAAAQVRFVDEAAGYQTGAALSVASGDGPRVTIDLAVSCTAATARAVAARTLAGAEVEDEMRVRPGPLARLRLEPGDGVLIAGEDGAWRLAELRDDERPAATLTADREAMSVDAPDSPRAEAAPAAVGRAFLNVLELPPLPGAEDDARPLAAVALEPWRPMAVWGGAGAEGLVQRARVERPTAVGRLVESLEPGPAGRWQETGALVVEIEGRAPQSRSAERVLAGEGLLAVETALGWEVLQYREATLLEGGRWRLTGLLRGRLGTEPACAAGAGAGAIVVAPSELVRLETGLDELGADLLWRVGPDGWAPHAGFASVSAAWTGRALRPWRPAQLSARETEAGLLLRWIPRARLGGDGWGAEPADGLPTRFRLRVTAGETIVRTFEVEAAETIYPAAELAADRAMYGPLQTRVAGFEPGYGWGDEAVLAI
ncbi:baseplate multidomain protein megatron [Brevundimonas balnearis]|uniref:Glycoside hydrolase TIM-barrel-like domain-containing protein n=1 Tax=Brevundimonas balnearis TaxID=1572858 RepID=A0ABV6R5J1_9CAUL